LGEDELKKKTFSLKLMDQGEQLDVPFSDLDATLDKLRAS
jgi:histidyl-tRNA synthetase